MTGSHADYRDLEALRPGSVFFLVLSVSCGFLRIFTEDRRVDLASNSVPDESHYIHHGFYFPETTIHVERLE